MKFNVSSSALYYALQNISKVIASKSSLPVLDSFLFELQGESLTLTASDSEIRLVTNIDVATVDGGGVFAVDAKRLLEPLKELPEQPLVFEINDETYAVNVKYGNGKFSIPGQAGDNYPKQKPLKDDAINFNIESQLLLNGISRTLFATADDELRPIMNGILLDIKVDNIIFVASDGHKLVRIKNSSVKSSYEASFILPKKPTNLLKSLLTKNTDIVLIEFDENNAYFKTNNFEMVCRLIEGRYPNYDAVIPLDNPYRTVIDRLSLLTGLKMVSHFASESSHIVKMEFSENMLKISAQDLDFSTSAEEDLQCQYDGINLSIGFKASYIIDILNNISSENVVLQLADTTRGGVIVPSENLENEDLLMLTMPLQIND